MLIELHKAFSNIRYDDLTHSYWDNETGQKLKSVTQFLSKLKKEVDFEYWAEKKAKEAGITKEEMQLEWQFKKELGNSRGSYLHKVLENLNARDYTVLNPDLFCTDLVKSRLQTISEWNTTQINFELLDTFYNVNNIAHKFRQDTLNTLVPIASEYIVGDSNIGIAGRFDQLYYNMNTEQYEIWDYKTDKKIDYDNKYGTKLNLFDVDDCEYNKYSLQLGLYKYIIEKNTGLKLGTNNIVHFDHTDFDYKIIEAADYSELIKQTFENEYNWTAHI